MFSEIINISVVQDNLTINHKSDRKNYYLNLVEILNPKRNFTYRLVFWKYYLSNAKIIIILNIHFKDNEKESNRKHKLTTPRMQRYIFE